MSEAALSGSILLVFGSGSGPAVALLIRRIGYRNCAFTGYIIFIRTLGGSKFLTGFILMDTYYVFHNCVPHSLYISTYISCERAVQYTNLNGIVPYTRRFNYKVSFENL